MIHKLLLIYSIIAFFTSSCLSINLNSPPEDTAVQEITPLPLTNEPSATDYSDGKITFQVPPGYQGKYSTGEYYDLGVVEVFTVIGGQTAEQRFTISMVPLAGGRTLEEAFALAYQKGPAPEEVEMIFTPRDELTGIELTYQRPWGEPRWRFHDLWVEIDGIVYVFSLQVYNNSIALSSSSFDDMIALVTLSSTITGSEEAITTTDANATLPPRSALIAFTAVGWTVPGSGEEIFVMNEDGSGVTAISNRVGDDRSPAFSADGEWIVFTNEMDDNADVYIMKADGTDQRRLTTSPENEHFPTWNPDGLRITFSRTMADGSNDIFMIDLDGQEVARLTSTAGISENYPNWSPNGKKLVYSAFGGNQSGIYTMDADGSNAQLVAAGPNHYPKWSPNGKHIAFDGEPGGCKFEIYIMKADGTELRQVTNHPGGCGSYNKAPAWSWNGKKLVYYSSDRGELPGMDIFTINIDGKGETQLTFGKNDLHNGGYYPSWSPVP